MKTTGEFIGVELLIECGSCAAPTPVNAPEERTSCGNCLHETAVDAEAWSGALEKAGGVLFRLGDGVTESGKLDRPGRNAEWNLGPARPTCPGCRGPMRASADLTKAKCPGCKTARSIEPLPAFLGAIVGKLTPQPTSALAPRVSEIVGVIIADAAEPGLTTTKELSMACTKCGASISSDGTKRTVDCSYCKATNILADDVWRALHPPKLRRKLWFLVSPSPRRAPVTAGEGLGVGVVIAAVLIPLVSACWGGFSSQILNDRRTANEHYWQHFAIWVVLLALLVITPMVRSWLRERGVVDDSFEIVGRLGAWTAGKAAVELFEPGDLKTPVGTQQLSLDEKRYKELGGEGALVRAWRRPGTSRFIVHESPSGLA